MSGKVWAIAGGVVIVTAGLTGCSAGQEFNMPEGLGQPDMPAGTQKVTPESVSASLRLDPVCPTAEVCNFAIENANSSVEFDIPGEMTEHEKAVFEAVLWGNVGFDRLSNVVEGVSAIQGINNRLVFCLEEDEYTVDIDEESGEKVARVGVLNPFLLAHSLSKKDGFITYNNHLNAIIIDLIATALAEGDIDLQSRIVHTLDGQIIIGLDMDNIDALYLDLSNAAFTNGVIGELDPVQP